MACDARELLVRMLETASPSGFEQAQQQLWAREIAPFADMVEMDVYGTTFATRKGSDPEAPRLMLEAHADEIGMMVQHITDGGFLHVTRIGGSDRTLARGRHVEIYGDKGVVLGVTGNPAIHLREKGDEKYPEWHDITIDIGADNREAVQAAGIRVGHPVVIRQEVRSLGEHRLSARAIDNRISGYILIEVFRKLASNAEQHPATIHAVNAVQEEIGGNGARMIAFRVEPTVAIVLDVAHATDSPGLDASRHGQLRLGSGPTLTHGTSNHPEVVARLLEIAMANGIGIQHEASSYSTGTDTEDIQTSRSGVASALVSIPLRYMHSPVETVDLRDVRQTIDLIAAFAASLNRDTLLRHILKLS